MKRTWTFLDDGKRCTVPLTVKGGTVEQAGPVSCGKHVQAVEHEERESDCDGCGGAIATLEYIGRGALKFAWSKISKKLRPMKERERIWEICVNCPQGRFRIGWCDRERGGCGCILPAKIMLKNGAAAPTENGDMPLSRTFDLSLHNLPQIRNKLTDVLQFAEEVADVMDGMPRPKKRQFWQDKAITREISRKLKRLADQVDRIWPSRESDD